MRAGGRYTRRRQYALDRAVPEQVVAAGAGQMPAFEQDRLRDKLRITIGTREQNDALLAAIDEFAKG